MPDSTVLHRLPQLTWRNLAPVPCESHPYDVTHDQAELVYPYTPIGRGHDDTGTSVNGDFKLFFLNTLSGGTTYYPDVWDPYRSALLDRSAGDLNHPDLGAIRARVLAFHVEQSAHITAGVIVDVKWALTIDDPTEEVTLGGGDVDPDTAAEAAQTAVSAVLGKYPDGVSGGMDIFEAWSSIKGQIGSSILSVTGSINQFQGKIDGMIDDVESLQDPEMHPALTGLKSLWGALQDHKKKLEEQTTRSVGTLVLDAPATLTGLATRTGNTVADLVQLNPQHLAKPKVPKFAIVKFYRGASAKTPLGIPLSG